MLYAEGIRSRQRIYPRVCNFQLSWETEGTQCFKKKSEDIQRTLLYNFHLHPCLEQPLNFLYVTPFNLSIEMLVICTFFWKRNCTMHSRIYEGNLIMMHSVVWLTSYVLFNFFFPLRKTKNLQTHTPVNQSTYCFFPYFFFSDLIIAEECLIMA